MPDLPMTVLNELARRRTAVDSLYRIRAVEGAFDEEGLKSVWHQTADGADLLSYVNREGRVVRQELTLLRDYFCWTSAHGLKTGTVISEAGIRKSAVAGSHDFKVDAALDVERLSKAAVALNDYGGEDRYIQHIGRVLSLALRGLQTLESAEVTETGRTISREDLKRIRASHADGSAPPVPTGRARKGMPVGLLLAAGLAFLALAVAALLLQG